jgi:hypothetical protein
MADEPDLERSDRVVIQVPSQNMPGGKGKSQKNLSQNIECPRRDSNEDLKNIILDRYRYTNLLDENPLSFSLNVFLYAQVYLYFTLIISHLGFRTCFV